MPKEAIAFTTSLKTARSVSPSLMNCWYWGCPQNQSEKSSITSRIRERKFVAAVRSEKSSYSRPAATMMSRRLNWRRPLSSNSSKTRLIALCRAPCGPCHPRRRSHPRSVRGSGASSSPPSPPPLFSGSSGIPVLGSSLSLEFLDALLPLRLPAVRRPFGLADGRVESVARGLHDPQRSHPRVVRLEQFKERNVGDLLDGAEEVCHAVQQGLVLVE